MPAPRSKPAPKQPTAGRAALTLTEAQGVRIAKALADPSRWRIIQALRSKSGGGARSKRTTRGKPIACDGLTCGEVGQLCPQRQPTVSHHVRTLERSGLITVTKQGQFHLLTLNEPLLKAWLRTLAPVRPMRAHHEAN